LRVKVLGEDLIAFRDTDGRVGLVDAYCPHRGAPMFFGRNEENGLRCVYHGWKFDVDGVCTDLPNAPEGETFKNKIHIKYYPITEAGDLVWAYMGPIERKPPFPEFEWTKLGKEHRYINKFRLECNYLQAMEGDYDPSHGGFLHSTLDDVRIPNPLLPSGRGVNQVAQIQPSTRRANLADDVPSDEPFPKAVGNRRITRAAPGFLEDTDAAILTLTGAQTPDGKAVATANATWMMPIFCTAGIGGMNTFFSNMRIPIDNESLMFYRLRWSYEPIPERDLDEYKHGEYFYPALVPGTWQPRDNVHNDYNVDRVAQKYFSYTGIKTFPLQDIAMMEHQWGPIADRTQEHLTSMDHVIIKVRRRLLAAAKALREGVEPEAPFHPEEYRYHRTVVTLDNGNVEQAIDQARAESRSSQIQQKVAPQITV